MPPSLLVALPVVKTSRSMLPLLAVAVIEPLVIAPMPAALPVVTVPPAPKMFPPVETSETEPVLPLRLLLVATGTKMLMKPAAVTSRLCTVSNVPKATWSAELTIKSTPSRPE